MITLVVPIVDGWEYTQKCIQRAVQNSRHAFELVVIDNGSDKSYYKDIKKLLRPNVSYQYIRNEQNLGVIAAFVQATDHAVSDIICFIHNDVLIQESQWEKKIEHYFDNDPKLGLAGLLGGNGVHPDGGRMNVVSNMLGKEWGKCDICHTVAALHHGSQMTDISPAIVLDGVGLFFRRTCLEEIIAKTTALDETVRAPHHWYDRNLTLNATRLGWHVAVIGVAFDHWSGATANSSTKYHETAMKWMDAHPEWLQRHAEKSPDEMVYWTGENQFGKEWASLLPAMIDGDYNVRWKL